MYCNTGRLQGRLEKFRLVGGSTAGGGKMVIISTFFGGRTNLKLIEKNKRGACSSGKILKIYAAMAILVLFE